MASNHSLPLDLIGNFLTTSSQIPDANGLNLELSIRQRVLLSTDGTVTQLLALYAGEAIRVTKLSQQIVNDQPEELALEEPVDLLEREILLSGAERHYLYAHSLFVLPRMSKTMQAALLQTDEPIGLVWQRERLESFRDIREVTLEHREDLRVHFPDAADARFLSRRYLVYHGGAPLGTITEMFPLSYFSRGD